jgi:predicted porin
MKKSLIVLAALTGFAGVAAAQSSVTLFGIADLAARSVKNGNGTIKSLSHSGSASTRLGLRGTEDLGGGMRAGFWLEGTLSLDDGNATGQNWQRRSMITLSGGFGEIRLGREYTPDFWNHTVFDPFATTGVGNSVNTFPGLNGVDIVRANNAISYHIPRMGGLYGEAMIAAAEGPTGRKHTGLRVGYSAGPLNIAASMGKNDIGVLGYDRTNLGASYAIGKSTLMFQYNKGKASGGALNGFSVTHMVLGGRFPVGTGSIKASYVRSDGKGAGRNNQDATQMAFGYEQPLSRRTALFGHFAKINNKAQAAYSMAGGLANRAGAGVTGYEFGIRHSF